LESSPFRNVDEANDRQPSASKASGPRLDPPGAATTRKVRRPHSKAKLAGILLVASLAFAWMFQRPLFQGNLGVVDPGRVIRSAQPTGRLSGWIQKFGLASVLNLRGGSIGDPWYVSEVEEARDGNVDFYDFPMSATKRPSRRELLTLIEWLPRCRYPLLIHCKSGADRTGLVSALYLMVMCDVPPEKAMEAFSLSYGHVPLLGPERLHEPLIEYGDWLAANGLVHSPERFRTWVKDEYQAADPAIDPPSLTAGPRESGGLRR
jgi:hypothetical protein